MESAFERTLSEISKWGSMSNKDRMSIMHELKGRKSTHSCPSCGGDAYCAMEAGKSGSACWCIGVHTDNKNLSYTDNAKCFCRKCLQNSGVRLD